LPSTFETATSYNFFLDCEIVRCDLLYYSPLQVL